ncbi:MAG: regulatory protein RecX [Acidobacteria bacterium]|nr:regulatory protein RecX [Acidobacteriota bacterium]MBI3658491.1 regulatory protein RecX [Acidobacteriota bacterium]
MNSYQELYTKGLKLLALRAHSEEELAEKLARTGSAEDVARVLADFKAINLINDLDFARAYALYKLQNRPVARARAALDLRKKKVRKPVIERALDEVYANVDEAALADQLIARWLARWGKPEDVKAVKRLAGFLQRQGFPSDLLYDKLSPYFSALESSSRRAKDTE